jgi:hypothetical protein
MDWHLIFAIQCRAATLLRALESSEAQFGWMPKFFLVDFSLVGRAWTCFTLPAEGCLGARRCADRC